MEAGPENCLVMRIVTSSCLSGHVHLATTRRRPDDWEDKSLPAPRELELSELQHTQMYLPDLPTAVTP
jgi:hypothetical protein